MRAVGIHLLQPDALTGTPRPSVVAEIDPAGVLVGLREADDDASVVAAVGDAPALVLLDAPLVAPNRTGRRDVEVVLAWLDCPAFPVSRERLVLLYGGVRGERVASALRAAGHRVAEAVPDVVLRHLRWTAAHPGGEEVGLEAFRAGWLGLRAPRYRPKGAGRADPRGLGPARDLLASAVDLGGWRPTPSPTDWEAIADAARIDAIACALTARLLLADPPGAVAVGDPERGEVVIPAGPDMAGRLRVNLRRLRAEGAIRI